LVIDIVVVVMSEEQDMLSEMADASRPHAPDAKLGYTYRFAWAQSLGPSDLAKLESSPQRGLPMARVLHAQFRDWLYDESNAYSLEVETRVKGGNLIWCKPDVVVFGERCGEVVLVQLVAGPEFAALKEQAEVLKVVCSFIMLKY
jgi:hypothetical protein